ncbi:MAG: hypothetical protein HEP71_04980 [Roseivirga sp.]|nr:hypothetical protein [Roseivirga sp.]
MKYRVLLSLVSVLIAFDLSAQEEFIVGKSANSLNKGFTIISAEYNAFAFDNIKARRAGLDISYGVTDRFSLFLRGSLSDFTAPGLEFETGTLTALYRIIDIYTRGMQWSIASFAQASVISRTAQVAADINFEGNNSGFGLGLVANLNSPSTTIGITVSYAKINVPRFVDGFLDGHGILYQLSTNKRLNIFPNQTNFDVSIIYEVIGQRNTEIGTSQGPFFDAGSYTDLLGGLQFTIDNTYRIEMALQTEIQGDIDRFTQSLYHIRLKYML